MRTLCITVLIATVTLGASAWLASAQNEADPEAPREPSAAMKKGSIAVQAREDDGEMEEGEETVWINRKSACGPSFGTVVDEWDPRKAFDRDGNGILEGCEQAANEEFGGWELYEEMMELEGDMEELEAKSYRIRKDIEDEDDEHEYEIEEEDEIEENDD